MEKEFIITADGSTTLKIPKWNVTYHSIHGAIQESKHVFIEAGLNYFLKNSTKPLLNIFEMGLGTGLNVFLTAIEAEKLQKKIHYTAIESFPLSIDEARKLNYPSILDHEQWFKKMHECKWNEDASIGEFLTLKKENKGMLAYSTHQRFDIIYYDAFAPAAQPELWTKEVFQKLLDILQPGGVLVTYCSKGDVRRAMIAAGFEMEKLPGPPGKREMLRGTAPFRLCPTGEGINPQTRLI